MGCRELLGLVGVEQRNQIYFGARGSSRDDFVPGCKNLLQDSSVTREFLRKKEQALPVHVKKLAPDLQCLNILQDCYKLMCIVAPEIAQYSDGIQTLQSETAARKATSKEKEDQLADQKLPLFEQIQARQHFAALLLMH